MLKDIKEIIKWTLEYLGMYSEDAAKLVYRTGMAESGYRALRQRGGPAVGFFQVEPATMIDTIENYVNYRPELKIKLYGIGYDDTDAEMRLLSNIALQVAFCRLKYRRDPKAIPSSIGGQARYWKRVYNSEMGKGTTEHFLTANGA